MTQQEPPMLPLESSPLDVTWADVRVELDGLQNKKHSTLGNLTTLVVTLVLFVALGIFSFSGMNIVILVVVLLVHESGHFIGMKLFGYRDVRMFFIPMLGAAVSGRQSNPSSTSQAIVALLGPVPGIFIGVVFGVLHILQPDLLVYLTLSRYFLFLNLFNLLPLHPLDGGRFLDQCLFSRSATLEVVFRFLTALCLIGVAVLLKAFILGMFAFFMLISTGNVRLAGGIAAQLKKEIPPEECASMDVPDEHLFTITEMLNQRAPKPNHKARYFAIVAQDIWERVRNRAPSVAATAVLLGVYVCSVFFGLVSMVGIEVAAGIVSGRLQ